jgi:hypothetical protein
MSALRRGPHSHRRSLVLPLDLPGSVTEDSQAIFLTLDPPKNKAFETYPRLSIRERCLPTRENGG